MGNFVNKTNINKKLVELKSCFKTMKTNQIKVCHGFVDSLYYKLATIQTFDPTLFHFHKAIELNVRVHKYNYL